MNASLTAVGNLKAASWEEALGVVAAKLQSTAAKDIAAVVGPLADAEVGCRSCRFSMLTNSPVTIRSVLFFFALSLHRFCWFPGPPSSDTAEPAEHGCAARLAAQLRRRTALHRADHRLARQRRSQV